MKPSDLTPLPDDFEQVVNNTTDILKLIDLVEQVGAIDDNIVDASHELVDRSPRNEEGILVTASEVQYMLEAARKQHNGIAHLRKRLFELGLNESPFSQKLDQLSNNTRAHLAFWGEVAVSEPVKA